MLKSKINIAYVVLDFKLSGVPIHILDLVKCLEKDKYNPLICCIRERGELAGDAEALGCEVIVINRMLSFFTDKVVAVSEAVKKDICCYDRINPKKITVIPYGIDVDRFIVNKDKKEIKEKIGLPSDTLIVVITGRLATNKRHDILIKAMKIVVNRFPSAQLMIVGKRRQRRD